MGSSGRERQVYDDMEHEQASDAIHRRLHGVGGDIRSEGVEKRGSLSCSAQSDSKIIGILF